MVVINRLRRRMYDECDGCGEYKDRLVDVGCDRWKHNVCDDCLAEIQAQEMDVVVLPRKED